LPDGDAVVGMREFLTAVFGIVVVAGSGMATTIRVPTDYSTIQGALIVAGSGDTILVSDGTYSGLFNRDIDFFSKAVSLISENGSAHTTLDFGGSAAEPHRGLIIDGAVGPAVTIKGFTVRSAYLSIGSGGAVYFTGDSLIVSDCVFEANCAPSAGAIACAASYVIVIGCPFEGNAGGAAVLDTDSLVVVNCVFSKNTGANCGALVVFGSRGELSGTICDSNTC